MTNLDELRKRARDLRISIIEMLAAARSGHPGGSLSSTEIITALYFSEMRHDPERPLWADRDRLVLSKGHAVPAVYAAMAHCGYFSKEELFTLRRTGARLQGHPDRRRLPGIEASTGSLGQGLSVAQGMALAAKLSGKNWHTYCILGDGETQEGQVWEAAMSAPKFKLGNLTTIIDHNRGQIDGSTEQVMDIEPIADKWRAFNWEVSVVDGHRFESLLPALQKSRANPGGRPHFIIANTIKGKGVSFMERRIEWHGAAPSPAQAKAALDEIRRGLA